MKRMIAKPAEGEYAPYAIMYINLLPDDGQVLQHLSTNLEALKHFVQTLPADRLAAPHEKGEWTVKEVLCHIIDTERVYAYRALRFARNDQTELTGFDQDEYVARSNANKRSIDDILEEYTAVRQATMTFFKNLDDEVYLRAGVANGHGLSVRAAAYFIAGHELHHLESIKENYG